MNHYRIFISYSSEDIELVQKIVAIIEDNGLQTMWSENFAVGHGFPDQIKSYIAHSHVFVPVLTNASSKRGWVHQEIGYATALQIPILPITLEQLPGEMLQHLQAIPWCDDEKRMRDHLSLKTFEKLVHDSGKESRPLYESADLHEHRTMMMVDYAEKVKSMDCFGHVRQKGALSSFHIPDKGFEDSAWQQRYGPGRADIYRFRYEWLRQERKILAAHAKKEGCSLIIDPFFDFSGYGLQARYVRLNELLEFLMVMPDDMVHVAIHKRMAADENITIVGNWFLAATVSNRMGMGYKQTIFTRHAPTIQERLEKFDDEFRSLLNKQKETGKSSRQTVMHIIECEMKKLQQEIDNDIIQV